MKVCVRVPASIANMGPGFDAFAIALKEPHEFVRVTTTPSDRLSVEIIANGTYSIPVEPMENTAGVSAYSYLRDHGITDRVVIEIEKTIKPCGGVGSSAASAVGALFALNEIYQKNDITDLIRYASAGEIVSSGAIHHDNTSASMLGGFVINNGTEFTRLDAPDIPFVISVPWLDVKTLDSRAVLGSSVSIEEMKTHISSAAFLFDSMIKGDLNSIGKFVNMENVVEKRRASLITGYYDVKKAALSNGAYGVSISGSGPSVFAVAPREKEDLIAGAMKEAFSNNGVGSESIVTESSNSGVEVVE